MKCPICKSGIRKNQHKCLTCGHILFDPGIVIVGSVTQNEEDEIKKKQKAWEAKKEIEEEARRRVREKEAAERRRQEQQRRILELERQRVKQENQRKIQNQHNQLKQNMYPRPNYTKSKYNEAMLANLSRIFGVIFLISGIITFDGVRAESLRWFDWTNPLALVIDSIVPGGGFASAFLLIGAGIAALLIGSSSNQ